MYVQVPLVQVFSSREWHALSGGVIDNTDEFVGSRKPQPMPTGQGIVPPAERMHNGVKPNCALKSVGRKLSSSDQGAFQARRLGPGSTSIDMDKNLLDPYVLATNDITTLHLLPNASSPSELSNRADLTILRNSWLVKA